MSAERTDISTAEAGGTSQELARALLDDLRAGAHTEVQVLAEVPKDGGEIVTVHGAPTPSDDWEQIFAIEVV